MMAVAVKPANRSVEAYLAQLGARVRAWRESAQVTRKELALRSGLSERYLAQLEAGQGNLSILLLRQLAQAMSMPITVLVQERANQSPRHERIALVGLRGAGKSTLGAALAKSMNVPFIELDREIEREAGAKLSEIFALYGQDGFRRFERAALANVLRNYPRAVVATGGSFVTDAQSYESLRASCYTVWLKARPEEHMARVVAQGDLRPLQGRAQPMDELRRILNDRQPLYALADATIDTSGTPMRRSLTELRSLLKTLPQTETATET